MDRSEAIKRISELSCPYNHVRMTDCPHCAEEVESLVKMLVEIKDRPVADDKEASHDSER